MTRDRRGDLWFATTGGLVHETDKRSRVYTTRDGLPDNGVQSVHRRFGRHDRGSQRSAAWRA